MIINNYFLFRIGLLPSSDDNDSDDEKNEVFDDDDDGIPSFDEEEPRTPQRSKPTKLLKKKRLSNEQVQKVLDSSDEDTPVKKRVEKPVDKPKTIKESENKGKYFFLKIISSLIFNLISFRIFLV